MNLDEVKAVAEALGMSPANVVRYFGTCHSALNDRHYEIQTDKWGKGEYKHRCGRAACIAVVGFRGIYPYCPTCFSIDGEVVAKSFLVLRYAGIDQYEQEFTATFQDGWFGTFADFSKRTPWLFSFFRAMSVAMETQAVTR